MIKGIVSGAEKDITRIPMRVRGAYEEGWEVRDNQDRLIWGREDEFQTVTGTLSFKGYGAPLKVKNLLGNAQQSGTPTPDAPIEPEFVGVKTGNLADTEQGGIRTQTGEDEEYTAKRNQIRTQYVQCAPSTTYTVSSTLYPVQSFIAFYDENKQYLSRTSGYNISTARAFETPNGAAFMRATAYHNSDDQILPFSDGAKIMLNLGSTALPYEPYGYKIPIVCAGQTTHVYLGQTPTVRRIKKLVLTGEEKFISKDRPDAENYMYALRFYHEKTACFCSHMQHTTSYPRTFVGINSNQSYNLSYMCIGPDLQNTQPSGNTVAGLKEYLAAQYANGTPVTVWYVLAEPETAIVNEPLCKIGDYADELTSDVATLPEIPTTTGPNTLIIDTVLAPSSLTIKGHAKRTDI